MQNASAQGCKRLYEAIKSALNCTFSFLTVSSAKIEEVLENCFILMLSNLKHEKVWQNSFALYSGRPSESSAQAVSQVLRSGFGISSKILLRACEGLRKGFASILVWKQKLPVAPIKTCQTRCLACVSTFYLNRER